MSDYENNTDSEDEEENIYIQHPNYAIVLIDGTKSMQNKTNNIFHQCLQDIRDVLKLIASNTRSSHLTKCGIILLGLEAKPEFVLQPDQLKFDDINKIIKNEDDVKPPQKELCLKDGFQIALDKICTNAPKNSNKSIILLTNNPEPEIDKQDDVFSVVRVFRANCIEFLLVPCGGIKLEDSQFYTSLFSFLDPTKREMTNHKESVSSVLKETLYVKPRTTKISLFYQENKSFQLESRKLFKRKYVSHKRVVKNAETNSFEPVTVRERYIDQTEDPAMGGDTFLASENVEKFCIIPSKSNKKTTLSQEQLRYMEQIVNKGSLELLWVTEDVGSLRCSDVGTNYLTPGNTPRDKEFFDHFWNFCVEKKKVLHCVSLTKKMLTVNLKPYLFKTHKCFLMYAICYADNYNDIQYTIKEYPELNTDELFDLQKSILREFRTNYTCIDIRDPKITYEQQLIDSKRTGNIFDSAIVVDETSIDFHNVDEKISDLAEQFKSVLDEISPPEMLKQKKTTNRPAKKPKLK